MTKRVLVADDEEEILALISATLGYGDYEVLLAHNGEEALRLAQEAQVDLVLLDIMMPKMDGLEVCRALKADTATASTKVVIITALAQEADRRRALEAGADDYFAKPFSPTTLLTKVEEILARG
ncbi:MAG: response regulator [Chloroflexi bacterium]|nr:response regulator [Chloroflexota bacterium]